MIRITKRVFSDLAIWMMGFGMVVGTLFPFFMVLLGMERTIAYTWWFFVVCILAGIFVGAVNIILAKQIVGGRLILLSTHMRKIEHRLKDISGQQELIDCNTEDCYLPVDSEDAIGSSSQSFNSLVDTLSASLHLEMQIRSYTRMLTSYLDAKQLSQHALSALMELFNIAGGAVLVEDGGALQLYVANGINGADNFSKNGQVLDSLRSLKPKYIDIPLDVELDGVVATFRPKTVFVQPIVYKQLSLGVVIFATPVTLPKESTSHLDLFIASFALALHNAMTYDQIERLAAIDPLTGVYNRRFGLTRLHEEFIRSVKQHIALGLLMIDIDKFKQVNDTYGHTVGDRVLQAIASSARNQLREGDLLIRLGGDEFMVVLLGANSTDVHQVGENIRRKVAERRVSFGEQQIEITVSIGGASFPEFDASDEEALIEAADRNLYNAKESGRNKMRM